MNPKSIGGLGMGLTGGGSLLSAGGAIAGGFANAGMYNYQAAVAQLRKQIADQNAEFSIQTGEQQAVKTGLAQGQRLGQIKVAQAAGGFDVNSGSNKQVRDSQRMLDQMDLNQIRSDAARRAYGYQIEGAMDEAQAGAYKAAASQSITSGIVSGFGSVLGGASSVASQWMQASKVGLWSGTGTDDYVGGGM